MRILLDQNLSPRLIARLADVLPGLESVYDNDLVDASDPFIFNWAKRAGISAIITADRDLVTLVEELGAPPKIVRIERCDYSSVIVEQLFRREAMRIHAFLSSRRSAFAPETVSWFGYSGGDRIRIDVRSAR